MIKKISLIAVATLFALVATGADADAAETRFLRAKTRRASQYNWHANYVHSVYGQPVALVVPPTAQMQTNWSWGASSAHFSRIDHQYGRDDQGGGWGSGRVHRTPRWPTNMQQFGVHYVRGPWYPTQR